MIKVLFYITLISISCNSCQKRAARAVMQKSNYIFNSIKENPAFPIVTQDKTGTCWAFAMTSFLESEIIRKTGKEIDLSEMYFVRNSFMERAYISILRHGQLPLGEGALNQDVITVIDKYGIVPYDGYSGLIGGNTYHDHQALNETIFALIPKYTKNGTDNGKWKDEMNKVLDRYLGKLPDNILWDSQNFNPKSFQKFTNLDPSEYLHITSINHKPFHKNIVLDIPWNLANEPFYNVPIDEFMLNMDYAIMNGFTVAVELDVSEPTYSGEYGLAVIPENDADTSKILFELLPEKKISQNYRQREFENFRTTNDHNQHIIGKVADQCGKVYYIAKNSWPNWGRNGYIYISEAYIKLKVIYYTVHKDGLIEETKRQINDK